MRKLALIAALATLATLEAGAKAQTPQFLPDCLPGPGTPANQADCHRDRSMWRFGGPGCDRDGCRGCCCCKPLCKLLHCCLAPVRLLTRDRFGHCCAMDDLSRLAPGYVSPAVFAAAKIKADEVDSRVRRAAVRFLGTVSPGYWCEAEAALLESMRTDRNEEVRLEAARALGHGCGCSPRVVEKLHLVASGGCADGLPPEPSERVKAAAYTALQQALARQSGVFVPSEPLEVGASTATLSDTAVRKIDSDIRLAAFVTPAKQPPAHEQALRTWAETVGAPAATTDRLPSTANNSRPPSLTPLGAIPVELPRRLDPSSPALHIP
jgi:hypothetical protein